MNISAPEGLRPLVRGFYQLQKLRIQTGNRLVNHYLKKMGVEPGTKKPDEVKDILKRATADHKRLTDALAAGRVKEFSKEGGLISNEAEFAFVCQYVSQVQEEQQQAKLLKQVIERHPVWRYWLKSVKGIGPLMAGVLLSELKLEKARYPSSFWKYCGLDVAPDGTGRSRRKAHLVWREYVDKDGNVAKKKSITFNAFLKTKVMGVMTKAFLLSKSQYRVVYDNYRNRLEQSAKHKNKSNAHKMWMARRYMAKIFLRDLFIVMCRLSGRREPKPYEEAKLGFKIEHEIPLVPIREIEHD